MLFTLVSCTLFILETYLDGDSPAASAVWLTEVFISASLSVLFTLRVLISSQPWDIAMNPSGLLDLATSVPVLLLLLLAPPSMRAVSILRVLRVLRTFTLTADLTIQPVKKQA